MTALLTAAAAISDTSALHAFSASAIKAAYSSIHRCKFVTMDAVRLSRPHSRWPIAAQQILTAGNGFQMGGVNASARAAEMVELQPLRDNPHQPFVGPSVSGNVAFVVSEIPVASRVTPTDPYPARALPEFDRIPETLPGADRLPLGVSLSEPSVVVKVTPFAMCNRAIALVSGAYTFITHLGLILQGVIGPDVDALRPFLIVPEGAGS